MKEFDKLRNSVIDATKPYQRFIPGLKYRISRCQSQDAFEINFIVKELSDDPLSVKSHYSVELMPYKHISYLGENLDSFTTGLVHRFVANVACAIKEEINDKA